MSTMSTNARSIEAEIGSDDAVTSPPQAPRSGNQIEAASARGWTAGRGTVSPAPPGGEPLRVVSVRGMESQTLDWTMSAQARRAQ